MSFEEALELSVVVPVLDEEGELPSLFGTLERQLQVRMELILSDGGSRDRTVESAAELSAAAPFPVRVVEGPRGRGRQLNRGAELSRGPKLLFLHADSRFPDPLALRKALDALRAAESRKGESQVAGRFALKFGFSGATPFPYRFYEAKARQDRPGCTHGDQGYLMDRACFEACGPFRESFLEDTFLAERIRAQASWILLPCDIVTSPRRFLSEGLLPRQTLNAVLMNLAHLNRLDLLDDLDRSYRSQNGTGRLDLGSFMRALKRRLEGLPAKERRRLWYLTGSYVRSQAWQIPFLLDRLSRERMGLLAAHDRWFERLTDNEAGKRLTATLSWIWFRIAARD